MKGRTAKDVVERERRFPTGHRDGYDGFSREMKARKRAQLEAWRDGGRTANAVFDTNDILAAYNNYPPEPFSQAYDLSEEDFDGELRYVQLKYLSRFKNIRRAWARLLQYVPEAMTDAQNFRFLEMSTAHGATLEVLRYFGHEVMGNDFSNAALHGANGVRTVNRAFGEDLLADQENAKAEWRYRAIIESLDLDVKLFDAGLCPYPFDDNAFDYILCFDALEHYCHPRDWMKVIDEFTRIAETGVVVEINPIRRERVNDAEFLNAIDGFYQAMLRYSARGFRCVATASSYNQPRFFKLMRIA